MSKSLGNIVSIRAFLSKHEADALRMMVLNSSYRNPLTFSDDVIAQAEKALERLRTALRPAPASNAGTSQVEQALQQQIDATRQGFAECMDDDFNTAGALGHMFDLVRVVNQSKDAGLDVTRAQALLREQMEVFGLRPERVPIEGGEAAPFVDLLVMIRKELRQQKLWALSDLVRDRLVALGIVLEDSKEGTTWRWR